jgi:hypothetical protein
VAFADYLKKGETIVNKLRKLLISLFLALTVFTSSAVFSSCNNGGGESSSQSSIEEEISGNGGGDSSQSDISFTSTVNTTMHTSLQLAYIDNASYTAVPDQANGKNEYSKPLPVTIK